MNFNFRLGRRIFVRDPTLASHWIDTVHSLINLTQIIGLLYTRKYEKSFSEGIYIFVWANKRFSNELTLKFKRASSFEFDIFGMTFRIRSFFYTTNRGTSNSVAVIVANVYRYGLTENSEIARTMSYITMDR